MSAVSFNSTVPLFSQLTSSVFSAQSYSSMLHHHFTHLHPTNQSRLLINGQGEIFLPAKTLAEAAGEIFLRPWVDRASSFFSCTVQGAKQAAHTSQRLFSYVSSFVSSLPSLLPIAAAQEFSPISPPSDKTFRKASEVSKGKEWHVVDSVPVGAVIAHSSEYSTKRLSTL